MKKAKTVFRNAVLFLLIFLLASQPVLVAAAPQPRNAYAEAVSLALQGGERYLDSTSQALIESAELLSYLNVIQSTSINQLNEGYIEGVIARALRVAEQSSIALGAVNDLADGIEQLGGVLPESQDIATAINVPQEMRDDLVNLGISSGDIDSISTGASTLYTLRQAGIPAETQAHLLALGFTQTQIDEIAIAVSQRGLVNQNLDTRMAQFRATQDELSDTRSGMLILAVQLLGYQIAVRQADGIAPRAVTPEELQEIAEDELRLLVHAAHINTQWGSNPDNEIGEGDWWFIEHYAGRSAERLQALIVDSQNRGLVPELFLIQQMKMLAISARTGDAEYAKAELDSLAALLAHRLNSTAYYEQRLTAGLVEGAWSQLTSMPALRGRLEWQIPSGVAKNAVLVSQQNMKAMGVENLVPLLGQFNESNEENNINGLLIVSGLSFFDQVNVNVTQVIQLLSTATPQEYLEWIRAILTGDTDNPALLAGNIILSLIPVIGVIPDLATLATDASIFMKALSILGIIGSIGDIIALIPGLQGVGGAFFAGDAVATVAKGLFRSANIAFRKVLNGLTLAKAFDVTKQLTLTVVRVVGGSLGNGLQAVKNTVQNIFTGSRSLWGDFIAFVERVGGDLLLRLGFDEGSALVGRILRQNVTLTDEAIIALKPVTDELVEAGIELSDEAMEGLGHATRFMNGSELQQFTNKLLNTCSVGQVSGKYLALIQACDLDLENILISIRQLDSDGLITQVTKIKNSLGVDNFASVMSRYGVTPSTYTDLKKIFNTLGNLTVDNSKDVVTQAFRLGENAGVAGVKGPEALRALAGWGDTINSSDSIAKQLALRAAKDAETLFLIRNWSSNTLPSDDVLIIIGKNSRDGIGKIWGLGPNADDYTSGFPQFARNHIAQFYYTHPEYGLKVQSMTNSNFIFWEVNRYALVAEGGPIPKGMNFIFDMNTNRATDQIQADSILNGMTLEDFIAEYGQPTFRMKEIFLLKANGYFHAITDTAGNYIFKKHQ